MRAGSAFQFLANRFQVRDESFVSGVTLFRSRRAQNRRRVHRRSHALRDGMFKEPPALL